jgi:hypothetical protein
MGNYLILASNPKFRKRLKLASGVKEFKKEMRRHEQLTVTLLPVFTGYFGILGIVYIKHLRYRIPSSKPILFITNILKKMVKFEYRVFVKKSAIVSINNKSNDLVSQNL